MVWGTMRGPGGRRLALLIGLILGLFVVGAVVKRKVLEREIPAVINQRPLLGGDVGVGPQAVFHLELLELIEPLLALQLLRGGDAQAKPRPCL